MAQRCDIDPGWFDVLITHFYNKPFSSTDFLALFFSSSKIRSRLFCIFPEIWHDLMCVVLANGCFSSILSLILFTLHNKHHITTLFQFKNREIACTKTVVFIELGEKNWMHNNFFLVCFSLHLPSSLLDFTRKPFSHFSRVRFLNCFTTLVAFKNLIPN